MAVEAMIRLTRELEGEAECSSLPDSIAGAKDDGVPFEDVVSVG
jgi:hypothetical protein